MGLADSSGQSVVGYVYDAWGRLLETSGDMQFTLGLYNPLRYRGYVYDRETGLYYLESRYYNPTIGRFINADNLSYLGADGTPLSYNLFACCKNNPVNCADTDGTFAAMGVFHRDNVGAAVECLHGDSRNPNGKNILFRSRKSVSRNSR